MSYIGNEPLSVAFLTDTFSGNGSTVAFTMSVAPANTSSILVAVTGVVQDPSTYSVSGTTLTFSAAPPSGTSNISVRYLGIPASGVTTTAYRTVTDSTATAGQTSFTIPSYTVGYVDVYRNGVRLAAADYTATTGTTIVLASAASAGDTITTESFYVSSVLNAIPATNNSVQQTYLASGVAGTGPAFGAYFSGSYTAITNGTWVKIPLNTEEFDTNNNFDSTTNYRFTPTVAGYYQINAAVLNDFSVAQFTSFLVAIYKNGAVYKQNNMISGTAMYNYGSQALSVLIYMNGTTDYLELYVQTNGGTGAGYQTGQQYTYMNGFLARAA
jgi:hypothetical protein